MGSPNESIGRGESIPFFLWLGEFCSCKETLYGKCSDVKQRPHEGLLRDLT